MSELSSMLTKSVSTAATDSALPPVPTEEVPIEDFVDQVEANSLRDLDLRRKTGCTIIGYIAPDGQYIINPEADMPLQPKSKVIVLGRPEQIRKLNEMFHID